MNGLILTLNGITFSYPSSPAPLFTRLHAAFPRGWTGIVGANGTGKSTLLRLAVGELIPSGGRVERPGPALYCPQRTDDPPASLDELLAAEDGEARRLKGALSISGDWTARWRTLSHGERKRCQIAVAIWQAPEVLAIDEPTNHVDAFARGLLMEAMRTYRGVGLLVSHDRELLDGLCRSCLFLEPAPPWGGTASPPVMRSGTYTEASAVLRNESEHARERYEKARTTARTLARDAADRKREASETHARLSKRGLARGDKDAKSRIDAARLTGKDRVSARKHRAASMRLDRARHDARVLAAGRPRDVGLMLPSRETRRDTLFHVGSCSLALGGTDPAAAGSASAASAASASAAGVLSVPELVMYPSDRIGLTGPNGAGKSTLVRRIVAEVAGPRVLYLPQEIEAESSRRILENVKALPPEELGRVMTVVGLLGTEPERILRTDEPSPGEIRKILIAFGIAEPPELIVMDEPTNHLDLPSIECLAEALGGCACGLFLVSHDMRFLDDVTTIRWRIEPESRRGGRGFRLDI